MRAKHDSAERRDVVAAAGLPVFARGLEHRELLVGVGRRHLTLEQELAGHQAAVPVAAATREARPIERAREEGERLLGVARDAASERVEPGEVRAARGVLFVARARVEARGDRRVDGACGGRTRR